MSKTILLIEDNPEVRENTAEILELSGYEMLTAENGKIGVKIAQDELPDLIICDIMMPELDGYGVLRILNRDPKTASIPFVFLTAKAEMADLRKGMNLGADDYLTKPFDDLELLDSVEMRMKKGEITEKPYERNLNGIELFFQEAKGMDALSQLSGKKELRYFKSKSVIYAEGSYPFGLLFVTKGKVKTIKTNADAKDFVTGLYKEGDFLGYSSLLTEKPYNESAVALEETEVAVIPSEDFFALLYNNRDVSNKFIRMLADNLFEKEEKLLHLAYDTVRKRVADSLLTLQERYQEQDDPNPFSMRISRENLAGMVGTSKECVIRVLSDFKEEGIVSTHMSEVTILNNDKLQEVRW
ncbi:MAG: response regulator [Bacteroidia bacterium]